jgi:hypothetical protein
VSNQPPLIFSNLNPGHWTNMGSKRTSNCFGYSGRSSLLSAFSLAFDRRNWRPHKIAASCTRAAYCVTFLPRPRMGGRDNCVIRAGQIVTELSAGIEPFRSENCSGFEFGELLVTRKLRSYNLLRQARREMSVCPSRSNCYLAAYLS